MPRTDSFGFVHPAMADVPTIEGYIHIGECGQCQTDFPDLGKMAVAFVAHLEAERRGPVPQP